MAAYFQPFSSAYLDILWYTKDLSWGIYIYDYIHLYIRNYIYIYIYMCVSGLTTVLVGRLWGVIVCCFRWELLARLLLGNGPIAQWDEYFPTFGGHDLMNTQGKETVCSWFLYTECVAALPAQTSHIFQWAVALKITGACSTPGRLYSNHPFSKRVVIFKSTGCLFQHFPHW